MNNELLAKAREKVPDAKTLIILASKRARLLATGAPPMVRSKSENFLDVALQEIGEGLLVPNFDDQPDDFMAQIAAVKAAVAAASASRKKED
ncbi:MAG: DNA-directed RNA polymerase subunit omega [Lentisphaeria bacterium]|nr:DNA-directed RNA polymerase subunit omega [Lentisphaeria bacterium]